MYLLSKTNNLGGKRLIPSFRGKKLYREAHVGLSWNSASYFIVHLSLLCCPFISVSSYDYHLGRKILIFISLIQLNRT